MLETLRGRGDECRALNLESTAELLPASLPAPQSRLDCRRWVPRPVGSRRRGLRPRGSTRRRVGGSRSRLAPLWAGWLAAGGAAARRARRWRATSTFVRRLALSLREPTLELVDGLLPPRSRDLHRRWRFGQGSGATALPERTTRLRDPCLPKTVTTLLRNAVTRAVVRARRVVAAGLASADAPLGTAAASRTPVLS